MQQTRNFSSSPVADPCGATPSSAASESQDMSTFLNQFFHHKHGDLQHSLQQPQPPPLFSEDLHWPGPSEWESRVRDGNSSAAVESSCGVSVSDPSCCYKVDMKASSEKPFSSADAKERRASSDNYLDELSCESEKGTEGSEVLAKSVQPRSSSKRSRAAEVHNLSEKRRRSRINEKMKALQNLIPNSNKTDKASMLDEAIEYLKQLQLQVQMLSMRNGLSLHPMFFMGVQQPMQLPQTGTSFDEGDGYLNSSRGMGTFYGNEESSRVSVINLDNRCTHSNLACVIPSVPNITIPETSLGFGESAQAIYEPLNLSSSKVIVGEGTQKLECDTGQIGKISQSDVS